MVLPWQHKDGFQWLLSWHLIYTTWAQMPAGAFSWKCQQLPISLLPFGLLPFGLLLFYMSVETNLVRACSVFKLL